MVKCLGRERSKLANVSFSFLGGGPSAGSAPPQTVAPMNLNRAAAALARRPPVSLLRSRALSNSSLHLLAKSYQLPTIVLGTAAEADIAALCERASASAFFRQGMPLVLDYAACDAEPAHIQQHLGSLRAQHLLPVGVTNVPTSTASTLASAGVPLLFSGGQGAARGAARGGRAASPAASVRRAAAAAAPPPPPPRPAAEAVAPGFGAMQVRVGGRRSRTPALRVCTARPAHAHAHRARAPRTRTAHGERPRPRPRPTPTPNTYANTMRTHTRTPRRRTPTRTPRAAGAPWLAALRRAALRAR